MLSEELQRIFQMCGELITRIIEKQGWIMEFEELLKNDVMNQKKIDEDIIKKLEQENSRRERKYEECKKVLSTLILLYHLEESFTILRLEPQDANDIIIDEPEDRIRQVVEEN